MSLLIKNAKIHEKNNFFIKNVFCEKGKIASITNPNNTEFNADKMIDAKGKLLLPGGIDCHVHFREPGMEFKGNWKTESQAAVTGGITSVIDMPNTIPSTTTIKALKEKRKIAGKNSLVNFGFHFGAEKGKLAEINKANNIASIKVFMGSSTGSLLVEEEKLLEEIFRIGKQKNILIVLHAEEEKIIKENSEKAKKNKWNNVKYHNKIRSTKAELEAIKKALKLQKKTGNRIHFLHVSTKKGMQEIIKAKQTFKKSLIKKGKITCEVCPHHLFLNEKDLNKLGNFGKMNPPLRTKKDNEFLLNALKKGLIDFVATDHAPHTKKEKMKKYFDAPSGVTGVETVFPLLLNETAKGKMKLKKVIEVLCEKPTEVYGIKNKGKIKEGFDADLILVDLNKEFTIKNSGMHSKCKWTPFDGKKVKGKIETTIINGNIVYNKGKINSKFKGKEIEFEKKNKEAEK
jgi:dihydroorotase